MNYNSCECLDKPHNQKKDYAILAKLDAYTILSVTDVAYTPYNKTEKVTFVDVLKEYFGIALDF